MEPVEWADDNPYFLLLVAFGANEAGEREFLILDVGKSGWMTIHADWLRRPAEWYLCEKAGERRVVATQIVYTGDQPYYVKRHVGQIGMAFVLITKRLLQRIAGEFPDREIRAKGRPPSYFRWDEKGFGEDMTFCQDAKKAGARIFVDTSIKVGHIGEITITEENFLRELSERPVEATDLRRVVNDKMGLPTVTAEEAQAKLVAIRG